jgi:hypothetical protein
VTTLGGTFSITELCGRPVRAERAERRRAAMKIFICWSGTWGKNAAPQIKEWLCEDVLKDVLKDFGDILV